MTALLSIQGGSKAARFVRNVWRLLISLFAVFLLSIDTSKAQTQPADVILRLDKVFWTNVAEIIAPIKLPAPFSSITLIDAIYCTASGTNNVILLVLLSQGPPAAARPSTLSTADCVRSTSDIISDGKSAGADAAAQFVISAQPDHQSLSLTANSVTGGTNGHISSGDLSALKNMKIQIGPQNFTANFGGVSGGNAELTADLNDQDLVLHLTQSSLSKLQNADSRPSMQSPVQGGDVRILTSHDAIKFVVSQYLAGKEFPIKNTSFVVTQPHYSAALDSVSVDAIIRDTKKGLSFAATVVWQGSPLKLAQVSAKSTRTCASMDLVCKGKLAAENLSAVAFAAFIRSKYSGSLMLPSTGSQRIVFALSGRNYFVQLAAKESQSQADALFIVGDIYLGVQP